MKFFSPLQSRCNIVFLYFPTMEIFLTCCFNNLCIVSAGKYSLISVSDGSSRCIFCQRWRRRGFWGRKMRERCIFPARVRNLTLYIMWLNYFSLFCTLTWSVNIYVSRQQKSFKRTNGSNNDIVILYLTVQFVTNPFCITFCCQTDKFCFQKTLPGSFPNMNVENKEPTRDTSWTDALCEVDALVYQAARSREPDQEETSYRHWSNNPRPGFSVK